MTIWGLSATFGLSGAALAIWLLSRQDARLADFLVAAAGRAGGAKPVDRERRRAAWAISWTCAWMVAGRRLGGACSSVIACGAAVGWLLWMTGRRRQKQRLAAMRAEWPVLLEGMAVAAMSGLDLNATFITAGRRIGGPLREETDRAVVRLSGGLGLSKALAGLAKDGVPGADRLRSILLHCEVLGTPVAEMLQSLALEASALERQELEGRFNALPLRLSLVTVVFLLPPVLVVSIAPHVLLFLNSRW